MPSENPRGILASLRRHLRTTLVAGLLLIVPVALTYLVLRLVFDFLNPLLQPYVQAGIERATGRHIPIPVLGIVAILALLYAAGLFNAHFLGRRIVRLGQGALLRVPIIGALYSASKQLIESFSGTGATGFKRVVIIEYPRKGTWTIGFLTGMTSHEDGRPMALVYIPTAPTPNSGWVAILPAEDVYDTDLNVAEALRLVLSGGILAPPMIKKLQKAS